MPRYKITDSNTGKQIIVSGDSPPTEDEINQIIGSVNVGEKKGQKETPIEDVPKNAWKDLKDNAQGIIEGTKYVPGLQAMSMMLDRKSTRLNSSHSGESRMPSSA